MIGAARPARIRHEIVRTRTLATRPPPPPPPPRGARPPPPPPPTSRAQPQPQPQPRRAARGSGTGGFVPLVLLVGAGVGGIQLHRYYKAHQEDREREREAYEDGTGEADDGSDAGIFSWLGAGKGDKKAAGEDTGESSRLFLQELAEKGDEEASKILDADKKDAKDAAVGDPADGDFANDDFRLDVSREGLIRTFTMMLEMKRKQEGQEIARIRRLPISQRPFDYEESLRQFREEKAELKARLKALQKNRA